MSQVFTLSEWCGRTLSRSHTGQRFFSFQTLHRKDLTVSTLLPRVPEARCTDTDVCVIQGSGPQSECLTSTGVATKEKGKVPS